MNKAESDLIIAEQNKSTEEILKAVAKVKSDYHELCKLKDKRIADLEEKLANADYQLEGRDIKIKELEKENAELNGKLLEQKQYTEFKCNEAVKKKEIYEREHFLLTKAKELIKKFSEFVNNDIEYDPEHPQEHTDLWNKLCEEAKQFISEVGK